MAYPVAAAVHGLEANRLSQHQGWPVPATELKLSKTEGDQRMGQWLVFGAIKTDLEGARRGGGDGDW